MKRILSTLLFAIALLASHIGCCQCVPHSNAKSATVYPKQAPVTTLVVNSSAPLPHLAHPAAQLDTPKAQGAPIEEKATPTLPDLEQLVVTEEETEIDELAEQPAQEAYEAPHEPDFESAINSKSSPIEIEELKTPDKAAIEEFFTIDYDADAHTLIIHFSQNKNGFHYRLMDGQGILLLGNQWISLTNRLDMRGYEPGRYFLSIFDNNNRQIDFKITLRQ